MAVAGLNLRYLFIVIFLKHFTTNAIFAYQNSANLSSSWQNNQNSSIASYDFTDGTQFRPILTHEKKDDLRFGFGFLKYNSTYETFYLVIIKFLRRPNSTLHDYSLPPVIIWSANGDSPVKENATLELTGNGDLILREVDDSQIWSANSSGRNVALMYLSHFGNLRLDNATGKPCWQSYDNPTNTWVATQLLQLDGSCLTSTISYSNLSTGMFYLTLLSKSIDVYLNKSTPHHYQSIPFKKIKLVPFRMELILVKNRVNYTTDENGFQFIRLESNGKLNVYKITGGDIETFDLSTAHYGKTKFSLLLLLVLSLSSILLLVIGAVYCYLRRKQKQTVNGLNRDNSMDESSVHVTNILRKYSSEDLKSATKDFLIRLGRGGFGSVYEGILGTDTKIAVKRLNSGVNQGENEFLSEVKTIGNIHHFNLVRLVGYCAEKSQRLLVYEYMCNGSLDKWIFHQNQAQTLTWETRKKIIVQIAKGLEYLHDYCNPNIIHFDIKPQNILLDRDLNVKISDFGLARLIDKDQTHVTTMPKGTPGYMAPELIRGKNISAKVDIYSLGVVILEIICGRKHSSSWQGDYLIDTVQIKAEENQLSDLVDEQSEDMQCHKEDAVEMIQISISCLQKNVQKRPSASMLVKIFEGFMNLEPVTDYNFLSSIHEETPRKQARPGDSSSIMASMLSGPR
ncbi:hypothetical protein ACOSP7_031051 [Xanthoceras sorbifolium]|uniref:Receptor-like serine/threonine-protein kinase n=1 Tax=Xanthoceras sorbifolium TaxID=99658 RepID=A0ABQ8H1B1_9ROSI|nr:hypothetical protein JRO89_XS15G0081800 [Xanthoceras sorbifolium]